MARPIIALLTDFGLRDHYVGSMKGAALAICPEATLVDITHDLPPHDVRAGSEMLAASYRDFPPGTVFAAVVDPGVGSARRALAVEAGDYRFVAPDNGLLSGVLAQTPAARVVDLARGEYARPFVSRTFEGRDRFAPAAAWLATGVAIERLGAPVDTTGIVRLSETAPVVSGEDITGEVVRVDRFGNLITNIGRRAFETFAGSRRMAARIGHEALPIVATYADVPEGAPCALFGSTDRLEIASNCASATAALGVGVGARVVIFPARD